MSSSNIIAGLDIGSQTIKLLLAAKNKKKEEPNFRVLFCDAEPAFGVRRGVVVSIDEVSQAIRSLLAKARAEIGKKIHSVFVNISGSHIFCLSSRGMVAVSRADRYISKEDVKRVLQEASQAVSLPANNDILEIATKDFIIDGVAGIKSPVNLQGSRLETEVLILSHFAPYKDNLVQAVLAADLQILDIIPSFLASATVMLSSRQKELGVALLEIGAGNSGLAVFKEGELINYAVFPIGSANITADIAVGLKVDIDTAEKIKIQWGRCFHKGKDKKEKIEIEGEGQLVFSQKMLSRIIEARLSEILAEAQKQLKQIAKNNLLPVGVVFAGGGAKLPGLVDLAKKELKLPCRLGRNLYFSELANELNYATASGLVVRGCEAEEGENWFIGKAAGTGLGNRIKKLIKFFLP
ncbi:MAG: cell division protein FtsA [Minisyncoccales bacterium]